MQRVTIDRLSHRGDGIADGPLYAPLTLPGEIVDGTASGTRLSEIRIITPSPRRVRPPCPYFKRCGGCAVQHADDAFVADWKMSVVRKALEGQGLPASIRGIHTSPPRSRRRATLAGLRTKSGALIGFHGRGSDQVIDLADCAVLQPDILALRTFFEALVAVGASRKTAIRLAVTITLDGPDVAVTNAKPLDPDGWAQVVEVATSHDISRLCWNGEIVVERRPPRIALGTTHVVPPPAAFLQATLEGECALQHFVAEACGLANPIVDLFCGVGTFALPLAKQAEVHAVEGDAGMLQALDRGWRHGTGLRQVTTEARDLFRRPLLPSELEQFAAAVIDPPRAGAEAQVRCLADSSVPRIAMVSCNPVTFARDARILTESGFALEWVDVIDQFRWSAHVEIAAALSR